MNYYDDKYWQRAFQAFRNKSNEYQVIQNWLSNNISRFAYHKTSVSILSVGCGAGEPDLILMRELTKCGVRHIRYIGVEVSIKHVEEFRENFEVFKHELCEVDFQLSNERAQEFDTEEKFDIILMIQMIYFIKNVTEFLFKYTRLLSDSGKCIIAMASQPMEEIYSIKGMRHLHYSEGKHPTLYSEVKRSLKATGFHYKEEVEISWADIEESFDMENEDGELILDFIWDTYHYRQNQTKDVLRKLNALLQCDRIVQTINGRRCYIQYQQLITISKPK